ncbi:MAG: type II toxin-antitoxin system RelE/ParE family toxin [Candidatus Acidiferrales bacterium]
MAWEIEVTNEFAAWFRGLPEDLQDAVIAKIDMLEAHGPHLGRPHADTLSHDSRHMNMKELRIQHRGDAYRILFAFDPRRIGILLTGGRKPDDRWYKSAVPKADKLYDDYLEELKREGHLR